MSDIATFALNPALGAPFDWLLSGGDLADDDGLLTAVLHSIFSDRVAAADDELPDNSADRRGYWGDTPIDTAAADQAKPDLYGSRLWLLEREEATPKTAARGQRYALEALQWLKDDGAADEITVAAAYTEFNRLQLTVDITRQGPNGNSVNHRYDLLWQPGSTPAT